MGGFIEGFIMNDMNNYSAPIIPWGIAVYSAGNYLPLYSKGIEVEI
ncbi:hypothetical protein GCM10007981_04250 [Thermocladium modestius]|uniref:Uncharacterized protein n=1 Tax=Thermocladium modestius TaxID=62609 RepID=A0A830GUT4_9CREN|nr:hypothetical protein [Thermocladium modestius]GGP19662.1 hypothetical protein GCM10007981_04250 [Thermocladium modestius]